MRGICPEDYRRLESLSSLVASPDGACAYTVTFWQNDRYHRRVELLVPGAQPQIITAGGMVEKDPCFSADGQRLYFLCDGTVRVYDRDAACTTSVYLPESGFEADGFAVTAGGLAVKTRREIREAAPEGCDWAMPLVADELHYRNDADHGFTKRYERKLLFLAPNAEPVLLDEGFSDWQSLCSAGEDTLIFGQGGWQKLEISAREKSKLALQQSSMGVPAANGRTLFAAARDLTSYHAGFYRYELDQELKTEAVDIACDVPFTFGAYCDNAPEKRNQIAVLPDGKTLAVLTVQAVPGLYCIEEKRKLCDESIFECACAGGRLWVIRGGNTRTMEVCTLENGACIPQAQHNAWMNERAVPACQPVDVPSLDGKAMLHGWYVLPEKAENAPVLLWIHGGPEGFYTDGLWLEVKAAVSRGFAVVLPNPRGSSGYGDAYQHSGQEFDQGARTDVLTILDGVLRLHPELDAKRVGVLGGSYGGYMSAMLAGTTKRFRASVVIKPVTNWLFIHFKSSQSGQDVFADHRDFQDFMCDMIRMSPIVHAGDVDIPTLIIHGEQDQQCPVENAHQYYVAVRDTHPDLPVKLIVMPDCCHGYSRDHVDDYIYIQQQTLDWLEKYV